MFVGFLQQIVQTLSAEN